MREYALRRIALVPVVLFLVSIFTFAMLRLIPGDMVDAMVAAAGDSISATDAADLRDRYGLTDPLYAQYAKWIGKVVKGDFGFSLWYREPAWDVLKPRFLPTFQLMVMAMVLGLGIGIPLGVISAVKQNSPIDYVVRIFAIGGLSTPAFVSAVLLLIVLIKLFHWAPTGTWINPFEDPWGNLKHMIWPALIVAWRASAPFMRLTRSQLLEVIREDYVRTARAKGLSERVVVWRHALRNAILPLLTYAGNYVGFLITGSVIVESVFAIPGLGRGLVVAAAQRDYAVLQLFVLIVVAMVMFVNLAVDLLYGVIDPRVRYR